RSSPLTIVIPGPPFNIAANDIASGTIAVEWQRSPGDTLTDTLFAIDKQKGTINSVPIAYPDTTGTIFSLVAGDSIGISLHSFTGTSDTLWWMTAERFYGIHLHVYTDMTGDTNKLQFPGSTSPDLVLDTNSLSGDSIELSSAALINAGWDSTLLNPAAPNILGGLANNFRTMNYSLDLAGAASLYYQIPPDSAYDTLGSPIVVCQTPSKHLVLVEIIPDPANGNRLFSFGPNGKYITVNLSFQTIASQPYAGRGRPKQPVKNPKIIVIPSHENILRKASSKIGTLRK
ncbi:MAG TPA: hypothetical protein VGM92_12125, partial [Candidatus Kapabacteria bacterium]